jgi:tyrosyl-tRNA synthetase
LDNNLAHQQVQFSKFLDFENGDNKAIVINNHDFYREMNVLDFLRDVGKTLTINYMMSKESVKKRVETGLSFTEFSYQLLQAYDFQKLYQDYDCKLQIGGSDQWGNITSGTEFIRRNLEGKAFAITSELLTKSDGSKFGKSEEGNIWLDPKMTSPYKFYQFWLNADDADLPKFIRFFTLKTKAEVEQMEEELKDNLNEQKRILAEELTVRVHSQEAFELAEKVSKWLFNRKADEASCKALDSDMLATIAQEIPSFTVEKSVFDGGMNIVDLLAEKTTIVSSKGEARRALKGNSVSINKVKISDPDFSVGEEHMLRNEYILVDNGKKNKYILRLQ